MSPKREPEAPWSLAAVGERAILREVLRKLRAASPDPALLVGAGDDAAAYRLPAGEAAILTTDTLVEGTHFRRPWAAAADLGWKLVMSAASDVSAMGGRPRAAVIAVSAPPAMTAAEFIGLVTGAEQAAREAGCLLTGGDTTASPTLVLTATVLGGAPPEALVRRSGAQVGDLVCVTGVLGEAGAGLGIVDQLCRMDPIPKDRWLRSESPLEVLGERLATLALEPQSAAALAEAVRRFLRPSPPFAVGPVLAAGGVTAAIDVSDGLSSEVDWIAQESGVGIVIDADRIPVGAGARAWAAYRGLDPLSLAFGGGEDYELLFTVPERSWSALERKLLGMEIRVAAIGQVTTESEGVTCRGADGFRRPLPDPGYEHFGRRPEPA